MCVALLHACLQLPCSFSLLPCFHDLAVMYNFHCFQDASLNCAKNAHASQKALISDIPVTSSVYSLKHMWSDTIFKAVY